MKIFWFFVKWTLKIFRRIKTPQQEVVFELKHGLRKTFFIAVKGKMEEFVFSEFSDSVKQTICSLILNSSDQKEMAQFMDVVNRMDPKRFLKAVENRKW